MRGHVAQLILFIAVLCLGARPVSAAAALGTIHGRVFEDQNSNGRYDLNEPCVPSDISLIPDAGGTPKTVYLNCSYGVYTFRSLGPGNYHLIVRPTASGYALPVAGTVAVRAGRVIELDFPVLRPIIHGSVTRKDGDQSSPLADAVLLLQDASGRDVDVTTTDKEGVYSFRNLAVGEYLVVASDPLGATGGQAVAGSNAEVVDRNTIRVRMKPDLAVYGGNQFVKTLSQVTPARVERLLRVGDRVELNPNDQLGSLSIAPVDLDQGTTGRTIRRVLDDGSLIVLDPDGTALLRIAGGDRRILLDTTVKDARDKDPADTVSLTRLLRVETNRAGASAVLALRADNTRGIYRLEADGRLTRLALLPDESDRPEAERLPEELAISDAGPIAFVARSESGAPALFQAAGGQPDELLPPASLVSGWTIERYSDLSVNESGSLAVRVTLRGTYGSWAQAVWRWTKGGVAAVAMTGNRVRVGPDLLATGELYGMERPRIGPDDTVVFGGWNPHFKNFYVARPKAGGPPQPILLVETESNQWSLISTQYDYAIAVNGDVAVRAFSSTRAETALFVQAPGGPPNLIAGERQQTPMEPLGRPAFDAQGRLFFQAKDPTKPRDRNGRFPIGLYQYGPGSAGVREVALPGMVVPGKEGQRLLAVPQRPVVGAKWVAFAAVFGGSDSSQLPTAGLFRVPLGGRLERADDLVAAEGDSLSFPAQLVAIRDFYFTSDQKLIFDTLIRRWLVVGQMVATLTPRASTAGVARSQAVQDDVPAPLQVKLVKGDVLGDGRTLTRVLSRLVSMGSDRHLFVAEFSHRTGTGEGLFIVTATDSRNKRFQPVAVTGITPPGVPGARFAGFGDPDPNKRVLTPPAVSADGQVVFKVRLERGSTTTFGVFRWDGKTVTLVGLTNPDPDNLKGSDEDRPPYLFRRWAAGKSGRPYFLAEHQTRSGASMARLFGGSATGMTPMVVPGRTAVAGSTAPLVNLFDFVVNQDDTLFVHGTRVGDRNRLTPSVLAMGSKGLEKVVGQGDPVPSLVKDKPLGLVFDGSFTLIPEWARGDLFFLAGTWKPDNAGSKRSGIFHRAPDGRVETILLEGLGVEGARSVDYVVIGTSATQQSDGSVRTLALAQEQQEGVGTFAFSARSTDGQWAIYRARLVQDPATGQVSTRLVLVAREGQAVTLTDGTTVTFTSLDPSLLLRRPAGSGPDFRLNAAGEVAFRASDGKAWGIYRLSADN
jgi:hypothetical protein